MVPYCAPVHTGEDENQNTKEKDVYKTQYVCRKYEFKHFLM